MSIGKRIAICLTLLAVAAICWFVPDPAPIILDLLTTMGAIARISQHGLAIAMKNNAPQK